MKCCVIQPLYGLDFRDSDALFEREMSLLERCDSDCDVIVLPEASDCMAVCKSREEMHMSIEKYGQRLVQKCAETARRCNSLVFFNSYYRMPGTDVVRNTTSCMDRQGNIVHRYFKQHLTKGECNGQRGIDWAYTYESSEPDVFEIDGIRFSFLTCYDFYFYESFPSIAKENVDVIIGCSHQRSDSLSAIDIIDRFLCYNTNAYLLRSSVSLGPDSDVGGGSSIVSPTGEVLASCGKDEGLAYAEFDPNVKFSKPAGFGNAPRPHWQYMEQGRRPMKYRPGGPFISADDVHMPYPRLCAHRGYGRPENSLPSLSAAIALGAQEIEFDIRLSKDGELMSIHDGSLERVSNGVGKVGEHTKAELLAMDFGQDVYPGLRICTFEEILRKLACHCVMNVHLKAKNTAASYDADALDRIWALVEKYDCRDHVYFMTGNDNIMKQIRSQLPLAHTCLGGGDDFWGIVDRAIALGAEKVQLVRGSFDKAMVDKAHDHGIRCNVYWSDDIEEARGFLEMGVDTILTNRYLELKEGLGI